MDKLRKFASDDSWENYGELIKLAIKNTHLLMVKKMNKKEKSDINSSLSLRSKEKVLSDFELLVDDQFRKLVKNHGECSPEEVDRIQSSAKEVFTEMEQLVNSKLSSFAWDYLSPLEDTNIITNDFFKGELEQRVVEAIKNAEKPEFVECVKGKKDFHAEMKIISELYNKKTQFSQCYIGISKLVYTPCQIVISVLNETRFGGTLLICGTHGGTYEVLVDTKKFFWKGGESKKYLQRLKIVATGKSEKAQVKLILLGS